MTLPPLPDFAPQPLRETLKCPHCTAIISFKWDYPSPDSLRRVVINAVTKGEKHIGPAIGKCDACNRYIFFLHQELVYPEHCTLPFPSLDMPQECKLDYEEARKVYNYSPRAAGALLRLSLQRLMIHLGGKGKDINADIKTLVANGLPENVQKAMDVVRVNGNAAVHPGEIRDEDMPEYVERLFELINFIVENQITEPSKLKKLYEELPESKRDAIDKRDGKTGV